MTTTASVYLLDLDHGTAVRHERPQHRAQLRPDLRLDDQPIRLLEVAYCRPGASMLLWVALTSDGSPTLRVTTPVVEVVSDCDGDG